MKIIIYVALGIVLGWLAITQGPSLIYRLTAPPGIDSWIRSHGK
jgi:hypothetical protein